MNTNAFRTDNTQGYSLSDLEALNAEFIASGGGNLEDGSDEYKRLCESILKHPPAGIEPGA